MEPNILVQSSDLSTVKGDELSREEIEKIRENDLRIQSQKEQEMEELEKARLLSMGLFSSHDSDQAPITENYMIGLQTEKDKNSIDEQEQIIDLQMDDNVHGETRFECGICFGSSDDRFSYGCDHYYCVDCVRTNLETAITDGLIESFKCPEPKCEVSASDVFVRRFVSEEMFARYEELMIKKAVSEMDDIIYCPVPECVAMIETEGSGRAECWKCRLIFCTLCRKPFHEPFDCDFTEEEKTELLSRIRDEEIAEQIFREESTIQLTIEQIEKDEREWLRKVHAEQEVIRRMENIEPIIRGAEGGTSRQQEGAQGGPGRDNEEYQRMVRDYEQTYQRERQKRDKRKMEDRASETTIVQTTKKCPKCQAPIEKNQGCIHMVCRSGSRGCGYEFCWKCLGPWKHSHICKLPGH